MQACDPPMPKTILITGASGAVGGAVARALADFGDFVLQGRDRARLASLAEALQSAGARTQLWTVDLADRRALEAAVANLPPIDVFVHAAGFPLYRLIAETDPVDWDALFDVHVRSAYLIVRRIVPGMQRRGYGRIIFVSSLWGTVGAAGEAAYAAAKGAQNAFVRSLGKELARSGITVNAVAPGALDTPMVERHLSEAERGTLIEAIPAHRLGAPEDVAGIVRFLVRDAGDYLTAQVIGVNGGWY